MNNGTLQLSQGLVAIVDKEDFERCSKFKWYAVKDTNNAREVYYAKTNIRHSNGYMTTIALHRFILNAGKGSIIDHIDGDGLNNRKNNLRFATASQNMMNQRRNPNGLKASPYKGIAKHGNKWAARIRQDGMWIHVGYFEQARDAAEAYDIAAVELFGEFARTNKEMGTI